MIRIDDTLLEEIGLIALPKQERDQLLRQIYETLEMRVGMRLAERMTDQQLDEFERFIDTNDEAGALKWLESNFPDYKQVVADELEKLKGEIKQDSSKIIEAMQAQGQVGAGSQAVTQPQQFGLQPQQPTAQNPPAFAPAAQPLPPAQPQFQQPVNTPPQPIQDNVVQGNFGQPLPTQPPMYQNVPPPPSFDQDQQPPQAA